MVCLHPILVKVWNDDHTDFYCRNVPCGKCYGCLINKQEDWVNRMLQEVKGSPSSYFITLTYEDDKIPCNCYGLTLKKKDLQDFMKRLRKHYGKSLRFFACGEYGSRTIRPHYHACIFLSDLISLEAFDEVVHKAWTLGWTSTSSISQSRMAYCAKYIVKGAKYPEHSQKPFVLMSRRPGIGAVYLDDAAVHDYHMNHPFMVKDGHRTRLPRYYRDKIGLISDPSHDMSENEFYWSEHRVERTEQFEKKMSKSKTLHETL